MNEKYVVVDLSTGESKDYLSVWEIEQYLALRTSGEKHYVEGFLFNALPLPGHYSKFNGRAGETYLVFRSE